MYEIITNAYVKNVTDHPLYFLWNAKKHEGILCEDWQDFRPFANDVGIKPSEDHFLRKLDKNKLLGPDNFKWELKFKRLPDETDKEFNSRRWANREKETYRNHQLFREFGIDLAKYNEMLQAQNGVCKICKQPETTRHHKTNKIKSLAVDHCHTTKKVRGLLCQRCNRTLGKLGDNIELLDAMKAYLNDNS